MSKHLTILVTRWVLGGLLLVSAGFCLLFGLVYWSLYHPGRELESLGEVVAIFMFIFLLGGFSMLISGLALKERD